MQNEITFDELERALGNDKTKIEPTIQEVRYLKARRYYEKYRSLEKRIASLKTKWAKKVRYYEKQLQKQ